MWVARSTSALSAVVVSFVRFLPRTSLRRSAPVTRSAFSGRTCPFLYTVSCVASRSRGVGRGALRVGDQRVGWTERRVLDPCYFEEKRRTRRAGKNVTFYRYNRLGRTWSYLSRGRVLYLWVHGLRQLCLPVSRVEGEVVTFSTLPVLRAHVSVCRLGVTKNHLGCRVNRVSHFQPYRSPLATSLSLISVGYALNVSPFAVRAP